MPSGYTSDFLYKTNFIAGCFFLKLTKLLKQPALLHFITTGQQRFKKLSEEGFRVFLKGDILGGRHGFHCGHIFMIYAKTFCNLARTLANHKYLATLYRMVDIAFQKNFEARNFSKP